MQGGAEPAGAAGGVQALPRASRPVRGGPCLPGAHGEGYVRTLLQYYVYTCILDFWFGVLCIHDTTCTRQNWQLACWISRFKSVLYLLMLCGYVGPA